MEQMARAGAAIVLAFAVCGLLVATAPARRPVDREAATEKLLPKPVQVAADAEAADQATAIGVPEEDGTAIAVQEKKGGLVAHKGSSLLCLVFRCGGKPAGADVVALASGSSTHERQALDGWTPPAVAGTVEEEVHGEEQGAYDSDSDCDSDEEDEGGIVGWFWRLADGF